MKGLIQASWDKYRLGGSGMGKKVSKRNQNGCKGAIPCQSSFKVAATIVNDVLRLAEMTAPSVRN